MNLSLLLLLALAFCCFCAAEVQDTSWGQNQNRQLRKKKKSKSSKSSKSSKKSKSKSRDASKETLTATESILEIAAGNPNLSILVDLVTRTGGADVLNALAGDGPFTLFAPLDSAFEELFDEVDPATLTDEQINDILFYHVLGEESFFADLRDGIVTAENGEGILVDKIRNRRIRLNNDVKVVKKDIAATNGVIHLIDSVLEPPSETIVAIADAAGIFGTLIGALVATNLDGNFDDDTDGPFTVFAPTDAAFEALGTSVLDALVADTDRLTDVLLYHVAEGIVGSGDLKRINAVPTLLGQSIDVSQRGNALNDERRFVVTDLIASNGVIHVIDQVLIPLII